MASLAEIRAQNPQYNDMSDQALADALHKKFYSDLPADEFYKRIGFERAGPTKEAAAKAGDLPKGERFQQGAIDVAQGTMQLGSRIAPPITPPPPPGMTEWPADISPEIPEGLEPGIDQLIAEQQGDYDQRRAEAGGDGIDWMRLGGNVSTMLPLSLFMPAPTTIPAAMGAGAIGGAGMSLLNPIEDTSEGYWAGKGIDAAIGAAAGGVTAGAVSGASNVVAPRVREGVKALLERGITPTPGQILGGAAGKIEERLSSLPIVGDMMAGGRRRAMEEFNVAAFNDVLAPIGKKASGKTGREGIEDAEKAISDEYKRILPNVTFIEDAALTAEVNNLRQLASFMPDQQFKQFEKVLTEKVGKRLSPTGTMDGETFKGLESELSQIAKGYRQSQSFDDRELGSAIQELVDVMRVSLERNNPMWAGELSKANQAWAKFKRVQRAATYVGSKEAEPGVFSPEQFQSAVKATDASKDKGAFAKGQANMQDLSDAAKDVLGGKVPDSGTPQRIAAMLLGTGGLGFVEPTTMAATGLLTLPYTKLGQKAAAGLLARRPGIAGPIAAGLRRLAIPAGSATGGALVNQ